MKLRQRLCEHYKRVCRFTTEEDGSYTIEFVIWMPIFAILMAIVMNLSMVFYYESQMLRVAQDATRAYAIGVFQEDGNSPTSEEQAEAFITSNLSFINAPLTVTVTETSSIAKAQITASASDLMPFSLMSAPFSSVNIGVTSQYYVEY